MALILLLLLLLLQDAQDFRAEFMSLWRTSALVMADSLRPVGLLVWKQHWWCPVQRNTAVQKPLGNTDCRDIKPWWLLQALISTKLNKSGQITDTALRKNAGTFAMPTLLSTTFSTSFACVWNEKYLSLLHIVSHTWGHFMKISGVLKHSLPEEASCLNSGARKSREKKPRVFLCCWGQLALSSSHFLEALRVAQTP